MHKKAMFWEKLEADNVRCLLCAHKCRIENGDFGLCGMRENTGGELITHAYGKAIANHIDPIEKKPLYHFLPGSLSYSIATIGCNFHCSFCQNWSISQVSSRNYDAESQGELMPEVIVEEAKKNMCKSISYTYTEPTIFFEYAYDTAKLAKEAGMYNVFVTNGYMSSEAIDAIQPYLDAANVDLKFFNDDTYMRMTGAHLQPVLDSIKYMVEVGIWVEVTTLVVPGENDSEEDLRAIAKFIRSVSADIPWHISRFHPDYKVTDKYPTMMETLTRAKEIGLEEGLKYIYLGNVASGNETICPDCGQVLIEREIFASESVEGFLESGECPKCGTKIPGIWHSSK